MKITATQLKKIIAEEIKKARLGEAQSSFSMGVLTTGSREVNALVDAVCDGWKSQFDPNDPSMDASGGRPVWDAQCDAACEVLGEKITELIMQVEEDLYFGKFYSENMNSPYRGK